MIALMVFDGDYVFIQYATRFGLLLFFFRINKNNCLLGDEKYTGCRHTGTPSMAYLCAAARNRRLTKL
jgi:hypothetical protein